MKKLFVLAALALVALSGRTQTTMPVTPSEAFCFGTACYQIGAGTPMTMTVSNANSSPVTVVLTAGNSFCVGAYCYTVTATNNTTWLAIAPEAAPATATVTPAATNPQATVNGLISTFSGWISKFDTNLNFQDVILWDGPVYQNQINIANEMGGSYDFWRQKVSASNTGLASVGNKLGGQMFGAVEARLRQAGIAGTRLSEGAGGEFGWMKFDFRAGLFADAVYLDNPAAMNTSSKDRIVPEVGLFADKMMTSSSAVGIFISEQLHQKYPIIGANLNVSFGNGTGLFGLF